jgi:MFS family permease
MPESLWNVTAWPESGQMGSPAMALRQLPAQRRSWVPAGHPVSWWMLVITTLAIFMTSVDAAILPTVLPAVLKAFHLSATEGGLINSLFYAGTIIGGIGFGIASDSIGTGFRRSWTWIAAMAVSVIAGILTFLTAASFAAFQALRVVMGISRGGSEPTNVALIGEWWQRENRGFAVGVHHTGFPLGQFFGPFAMAAIIGAASWQHVYLIIPAVGIPIMIAQAFVGTRRNQERVYRWVDEHGATRPLEEIGGRGRARNPWPLIRSALAHHNVRYSVLMNFLFLWAELGVATFITVDLTRSAGMSLAQAALVSGASGLTGWIGQVGWGTVSDHKGRKFALRIIISGWIVAVLLMPLIHSAWSAWAILLFWGLFRNSSYPVNYSLLIDSVPGSAGSAMGIMIGISFGLAGLLVSPVAGFVIDAWGFTTDYVMLGFVVALAFIPLALVRETVGGRGLRPGQDTAGPEA